MAGKARRSVIPRKKARRNTDASHSTSSLDEDYAARKRALKSRKPRKFAGRKRHNSKVGSKAEERRANKCLKKSNWMKSWQDSDRIESDYSSSCSSDDPGTSGDVLRKSKNLLFALKRKAHKRKLVEDSNETSIPEDKKAKRKKYHEEKAELPNYDEYMTYQDTSEDSSDDTSSGTNSESNSKGGLKHNVQNTNKRTKVSKGNIIIIQQRSGKGYRSCVFTTKEDGKTTRKEPAKTEKNKTYRDRAKGVCKRKNNYLKTQVCSKDSKKTTETQVASRNLDEDTSKCDSGPSNSSTAGPSAVSPTHEMSVMSPMRQPDNTLAAKYICKAEDVIKFKFITNNNRINDAVECAPTFVRHVFADGNIYGYENLKISVTIEKSLMWCTLEISFNSCAENVTLEDLVFKLEKHVPFFKEDQISPARGNPRELSYNKTFWKPLFIFQLPGYSNTLTGALGDANNVNFKKFHRIVRNISLWFTKGPLFLNARDPNNEVFYLFYHCTQLDLNFPLGFCTCTKLSMDKGNLCISLKHIFILPPYAKLGIKDRFVDGIMRHLRNSWRFIDLLVGRQCSEYKSTRLNNLLIYVLNDKKFVGQIVGAFECNLGIIKKFDKDYLTTEDEAKFLFDMIHYIHLKIGMISDTYFTKGMFDRIKYRMMQDQMPDTEKGFDPTYEEVMREVNAHVENQIRPAFLAFERIRKNKFNIKLLPNTTTKR